MSGFCRWHIVCSFLTVQPDNDKTHNDMQSGKIGVTTENIFPVIKKFLYSDQEIFLRELISNAVDATRKLKTLADTGEWNGELGDLTIRVKPDKDRRILTISDSGIGMTAEEVDKYINQIAFSSAEEFMEKYKNQSIIGHFGLGFYSAFMVADKVEIRTQSYREDAPTVVWTCEGTPEYTLEESPEKRSRGTDVILYLSEDAAEYAGESRIREMLRKYCRFLPVPIACGKVQEWKDGKYVDTDKDYIVNDTDPLWMRKPGDITDEQYLEFYRELYPMSEDPLFWIHLNIDYPFNLTGILYFPKIRNNFEIQKNKIQLYSNQVYVTDSVEDIVPEFLTLLHGVIDSPDIPLNVSRSFLQNDVNVRKISGYITRKVADRLQEIFTASRPEFEKKWDDLKIFVEYGIITDEKFADKAVSFMLLKNSEGVYFTLDEYRNMIKENQTDKNSTLVYLYVDDVTAKHSFVEAAAAKGYDVLVMNGPLDGHFISWFENKYPGSRFVRVDSDVIGKLIEKDTPQTMALSSQQQEIMRPVIESQLPADEKVHFNIAFEPMSASDGPVTITQDEYMRRMKEMAAVSGGGMSQFYGQMPDNYTVVVNGNNPLVIDLLGEIEKAYGDKLGSLNKKIESALSQQNSLDMLLRDKKESDITEEERKQREEVRDKLSSLRRQRDERLREVGSQNALVKQLIDLALLSGGMLKGEQLTAFIRSSLEMINARYTSAGAHAAGQTGRHESEAGEGKPSNGRRKQSGKPEGTVASPEKKVSRRGKRPQAEGESSDTEGGPASGDKKKP